MKKYEYAGIDVSTEKSAAILGLQRVEENKKEGEKKGE